MQLDHVDQLAASAFDGFIVRKDLVRRFKGQYPVPTFDTIASSDPLSPADLSAQGMREVVFSAACPFPVL